MAVLYTHRPTSQECFLMLWGKLVQVLGDGKQDVDMARCTCGFSSEDVLGSVS